MRRTARGGVSGVVIDPPGKIIPSNFVQTDKMDMIEENKDVPSYLDLASVKVKLNATDNTITFGQELFGLLPNQTRNLQYWTFVDTDEDKKTGASQAQLANLGVPSSNTTFEGADLVIKSEVNQPFIIKHNTTTQTADGNTDFGKNNNNTSTTTNPSAGENITEQLSIPDLKVVSKLWQFKDGNLKELKGDSYLATRVSEFVLEPQVHYNPSPPPPAHVVRPPSNLAHTPAPTTSPLPAGQHPVGFHLSNNVLYVRLDNRQVGLGLDKPFRVYGLTAENSPSSAAGQSPQAADVLGNFTGEQTGFNLVLRHPSYPICFPESQYVKAGGSVPMQVQGLTPQSQVNAYFDTEPLVGRFTTSSNGSMTVGEFAIPANATNGLHPVTFAVDGTAIAALCEVNVVGGVSSASSTLGELHQGQPVKQPSSNQTKHLDNLTTTKKVAPTPSPKPPPLSTPTPQLKVTQLTVKLQADSTEATAPATINFKTATSGSTQPYVYSWDFGDSSSNSEKGNSAVSHQYAKEGKYRAGVTVTDSSGQSASDSVDISITAAPSAETGSDTGTTKSPSGTNPDQTNIVPP